MKLTITMNWVGRLRALFTGKIVIEQDGMIELYERLESAFY